MVNGALHPRFCPEDFGFEQGDTLFAFLDRIGIEILLAQLGREIVLATGKIFVGIHRARSVDPGRGDVNKAPGFLLNLKVTRG